MREVIAFISNPVRYNTAFYLRPFYVFCAFMRRPGCFLEHRALGRLPLVSLHKKSWISVRLIRIFVPRIFFLMSKRSGGNSTIH